MQKKIADGFTKRSLLDKFNLRSPGKVSIVHNQGIYFYLGDNLFLIHSLKFGIIPFGIAINKEIDFKKEISGENKNIYFNKKYLLIEKSKVLIKLHNNDALLPDYHSTCKKEINIRLIDSNITFINNFVLESFLYNNLTIFLFKNFEFLFEKRKHESHINNKYMEYCYKNIFLLIMGIVQKDFQEVQNALAGLVGLGNGLTPSMDDVLVGIISTIFYFRNNLLSCRFSFADAFGGIIYSNSKNRTTTVSETFIFYACKGECFQFISDTICAILFSSSKEYLIRKINFIISIGSDSGISILLGILIGIKLCIKIIYSS